ncbi:MAG: NYN domain-containing protein, partial [Fimbriiglobus sp.]|nr:NYN domain-containing protein [Fimbriiglobus sp.]
MRHSRTSDGERILAVFIDFENLALGFAGKRDRFRIEKVLARLVEKGKIVAKKAYADWSRWGADARALHESAIELIEIPKRSMTGKNSADIRLVVDAVDLAYSKDHIDTFVIVSGDSDFSPLVSKLKELGKHVIGLGLVEATSVLLRDNCDEFIYYEDLDRPVAVGQASDLSALPEGKQKVFGLLLESLLALRRENKETIFSSMAKDTMKRKRPSFNEEYFGYRTFSELLEDASRFGLVEIEKHKSSGTYVVTRFGGEVRPQLTGGGLPHPQPLTALPPRPQPAPLPPRESVPDPRPQPPPRSAITGPAAMAPRPATPGQAPPLRGPVGGTRTPTTITNPPRPVGPIAPPPPPTRRKPDEDDAPVLGRSLIEDIDDDDFDD